MDSIGQIGFGVNLDTLNKVHVPVADAFDEAQAKAWVRGMNPLIKWLGPTLSWLLLPSERRYFKNIDILDDFALKVIAERRADSIDSLKAKKDILSLFLLAVDDDKGG
jgi:hypothetical protein